MLSRLTRTPVLLPGDGGKDKNRKMQRAFREQINSYVKWRGGMSFTRDRNRELPSKMEAGRI